jgi:hypothetical protein
MSVDQHTLEVMASFQRYIRSNDLSEVQRYSLEELRHADESLGHRDISADFRIALRNRMRDIEGKNEKIYQSLVRALAGC